MCTNVDATYLAQGTSVSSNGKPLIDAAFTAHPSGLAVPGDLEKVKLPLSIAHGTQDMVMSNANAKTIQDVFALKEKDGGVQLQGEKFEIRMIEGAKHGFAVRGNPDDKAELEYAQIGEDQAVTWFQKWLLKEKK